MEPSVRPKLGASASHDSGKSKFSDGSIPKLLYVGTGTSSITKRWNYDGSKYSASKSGHDLKFESPSVNWLRPVVICAEFTQIPSKEIEGFESKPLIRIGANSGRDNETSVEATIPGFTSIVTTQRFDMPKALKTADLEIGSGVGMFLPVAESVDGKGSLKVKVVRGPDGTQRTPENKRTYFATSYLTVTVPRIASEKEWVLSVFDGSGKSIDVVAYSEVIGDWPPQRYKSTCYARPEEIKKVILLARDREWIKYRKVALYPTDEPITP